MKLDKEEVAELRKIIESLNLSEEARKDFRVWMEKEDYLRVANELDQLVQLEIKKERQLENLRKAVSADDESFYSDEIAVLDQELIDNGVKLAKVEDYLLDSLIQEDEQNEARTIDQVTEEVIKEFRKLGEKILSDSDKEQITKIKDKLK